MSTTTNSLRITEPRILLAKKAPTGPPTTRPIPVQKKVGYHCTWPRKAWATAPAVEENMRAKMEVATATRTGKPKAVTKIGVQRNPPPVPKKLETKPARKLNPAARDSLNL